MQLQIQSRLYQADEKKLLYSGNLNSNESGSFIHSTNAYLISTFCQT